MRHEIFYITLLCVALLLCGCLQGAMRTPDDIDALLNTVTTLAAANVASAPVNPYAFPIGIGLTGIAAILEALRRKEREGRKRAEQTLNGNNSHN